MTGTDDTAPERDVELLLPWHAAGTLNPRDAERVEQALASDSELARRYAIVREELAETVRLNEALAPPSARAMESLFAKIAAEPNHATPFQRMSAWLTGVLASLTPRTLAWSASIALVAILVQAGLIADFVLTDNRPAQFETASAPGIVPAGGTFVFVRFAPQATVEDINRLLESDKLVIVDGPAPGGLYKVRVAQSVLPGAELDRIMKTLQDNKLIGFVAAAH